MSYVVSRVTTPEKPSLTFVIPVKDEQATLATLFRGIAAQATKITDCLEVIFVDDGSTDESWILIQQLAAKNPEHVKAIRFRHNAGKAAALAAGWKESRGDIVFTMDADLQDDPEEIPRRSRRTLHESKRCSASIAARSLLLGSFCKRHMSGFFLLRNTDYSRAFKTGSALGPVARRSCVPKTL